MSDDVQPEHDRRLPRRPPAPEPAAPAPEVTAPAQAAAPAAAEAPSRARNPKAVPKASARKDSRSAKTALPVPKSRRRWRNSAKAVAIVRQVTVRQATAVPVVTAVKEDAPVAAAPSTWPPEIELEKLISDSLYLDNQAHAVVARMRDMDSGTKSQLRRLYNAVRRAVRAPKTNASTTSSCCARAWPTPSRGIRCAAWTRWSACCSK